MRRTVLVPTLLVAALAAAPQMAAADTLFGGTFGGFIPRGQDGRTTGDVLTETFGLRNGFRTLFDDDGDKDPIKLFSGPSFGGEVLFGIGDFVEAGVGIGYYHRRSATASTPTSPTSTAPRSSRSRGSASCRSSVTVRAFPIGRTTPVQPYVGGGINFYRWQYQRGGRVHRLLRRHAAGVRRHVHRRRHARSARLILGGVRVPVGHTFNVGGEVPVAGRQRRSGAGAELRRRQAGSRRRTRSPPPSTSGSEYAAAAGRRAFRRRQPCPSGLPRPPVPRVGGRSRVQRRR